MNITTTTRPKLSKDLTKQPPRSPKQRIGGYCILGRTIDKCRAELSGQIGDYHYNCPLDQALFKFKEINGEDFKRAVKDDLTDQELIQWVNAHGKSKSQEEIRNWSDDMDKMSLIHDPEKRDYFISECKKLGLDPEKTTLFEWLDADDRASFKKK
jgi:hypothetical protein